MFENAKVRWLMNGLDDRQSEKRGAAVDKLCAMQTPLAREALTRALENSDPYVRFRAAKFLGKVDLLFEILIADSRLRELAARALWDWGEPQWLSLIQPVSKKSGCDMGGVFRTQDPRLFPVLARLLRDAASAENRKTAANALGELTAPGVVDALAEALRDPDPEVRREAAQSLGKRADVCALQPLVGALGDSSGDVRRTAVEALGRLKDPRVVEPLIRALGDSRLGVRLSAVYQLEASNDMRAVPALVQAFDQGDADVRWRVIDALARRKEPRAVETFIKALGDDSPSVVKSAAKALGDLPDPRAVEPLLRAIERTFRASAPGDPPPAVSESEREIRYAVTNALISIHDSTARQALVRIVKLFSGKDWQVPKIAFEALLKEKEPETVVALIETLTPAICGWPERKQVALALLEWARSSGDKSLLSAVLARADSVHEDSTVTIERSSDCAWEKHTDQGLGLTPEEIGPFR